MIAFFEWFDTSPFVRDVLIFGATWVGFVGALLAWHSWATARRRRQEFIAEARRRYGVE